MVNKTMLPQCIFFVFLLECRVVFQPLCVPISPRFPFIKAWTSSPQAGKAGHSIAGAVLLAVSSTSCAEETIFSPTCSTFEWLSLRNMFVLLSSHSTNFISLAKCPAVGSGFRGNETWFPVWYHLVAFLSFSSLRFFSFPSLGRWMGLMPWSFSWQDVSHRSHAVLIIWCLTLDGYPFLFNFMY